MLDYKYVVAGTNFGKSADRIAKVANVANYIRLYSDEISMADLNFCYYILDISDMVVEKVHILQLIDIIKNDRSIVDQLLFTRAGVETISPKIYLEFHVDLDNTLNYITVPYKGEVYYVISKCRKYIACVSRRTLDIDDVYKGRTRLAIRVYMSGIGIIASVLCVTVKGTFTHSDIIDAKLLSFELLEDQDTFKLNFNTIKPVLLSVGKNMKFKVSHSDLISALEIRESTEFYDNWVASGEAEKALLMYTASKIFNE